MTDIETKLRELAAKTEAELNVARGAGDSDRIAVLDARLGRLGASLDVAQEISDEESTKAQAAAKSTNALPRLLSDYGNFSEDDTDAAAEIVAMVATARDRTVGHGGDLEAWVRYEAVSWFSEIDNLLKPYDS